MKQVMQCSKRSDCHPLNMFVRTSSLYSCSDEMSSSGQSFGVMVFDIHTVGRHNHMYMITKDWVAICKANSAVPVCAVF